MPTQQRAITTVVSKAEHLDVATDADREIDWEQVFNDEFPRIYNYLRYRTTNDNIAEELAAETFARAWRSRKQYQADLAAFSTWLFTIARNLAIDQLRKSRPHIALQAAPEPVDNMRVDDVVQRHENSERLVKLLSELPQREAEIIALRYGADMSHRQIAEVLKLSSVNVRVILYRTVRKLRAIWEEAS